MESSILSFSNILLIIAISQGLLIATLLFHKYAKLYPNRFLGLLMLVLSFSLIHVYLDDQEIYNNNLIGILLTGVIFLMGPLQFLYAKYLVHPSKTLWIKDLLHFIPFLVFILLILWSYSFGSLASDKESYLEEQQSGFIIINWLYILHALTYYLLSIKEIQWYSKRIKDVFSSIERIRLKWLKLLIYVGICVISVFGIENILNMLDLNFSEFRISSVLGAIYLYSLGYFGITKSTIFQNEQLNEVTKDLPENYSSEKTRKAKYERSGLTPEKANTYAEQLKKLMKDERLYKDSNLTLQQLAKRMNISPHHLSQIINSELDQNFFDFVNKYRVDDVINNLTNQEKKHLTLLALGLEAGFNSKTTFNTIFKKFTNQTPSQYRSSLSKIE